MLWTYCLDMFRSGRKSVKVNRQQCASNTGQSSATGAIASNSNIENSAPTTSKHLLPTLNSKPSNTPAKSFSSFRSPAIKNGVNGFRSPMVPVGPQLNTSTGTKRKSIFEDLEGLSNLSDTSIIKSKPYASFCNVPLTTFDGSNYSIDFSVEPNSPSVETELDPFDDKMLTSGKPLEKEEVKAPATTTTAENYDELLNESFDYIEDFMSEELEIPEEFFENSPEAMPKNEGFRTAGGAVINISNEQRQQAMRRFQGLADVSKEVAGFIWAHQRQMLE